MRDFFLTNSRLHCSRFQVVQFCREKSVGLVVVGPEVPLVAGLADDLQVLFRENIRRCGLRVCCVMNGEACVCDGVRRPSRLYLKMKAN